MEKMKTCAIIFLVIFFTDCAFPQWPEPKAPVIPEADGYVIIPNAAVRPDKRHVFKAIFASTQLPENKSELLPALNAAGAELNALSVEGVPKQNRKFAIVFYGSAVDGILDNEHYELKFGLNNPNLKVIAELQKEGVELYVCGQKLAFSKIDPATLTKDVTIVCDAFIVQMKYENDGYALFNF